MSGTPVDSGTPTAPVALFNPAPPAYWYVDSSPFTTRVTGTGVTAYKYALDDAQPGAADTPVATPGSNATIPAGWHTNKLYGNHAAGTRQTVPTTAKFYMASRASKPAACTHKTEGGTCDIVLQPGAARTTTCSSGRRSPCGRTPPLRWT